MGIFIQQKNPCVNRGFLIFCSGLGLRSPRVSERAAPAQNTIENPPFGGFYFEMESKAVFVRPPQPQRKRIAPANERFHPIKNPCISRGTISKWWT